MAYNINDATAPSEHTGVLWPESLFQVVRVINMSPVNKGHYVRLASPAH